MSRFRRRDDAPQDPADAVAERAVARDRAAGTAPPSRSRARLRAAAGTGAGVLLLAVTAAVAGGSLAAGVGGQPHGEVSVPTAAPPAGDLTAVCAGPLRLLTGQAGTTDPEFRAASATAGTRISAMVLSDLGASVAGSAVLPLDGGDPLAVVEELRSGTAAPAELPAGSDADGVTSRIAGMARGVEVQAPSAFRVQPQSGLLPVWAAASTYSATDGDLRGLAATACQVPASESWLVGAATAGGASAILTLANPSGTPASVNVELYGQDGPIEAAGAPDQVVAPGATRQIVLAGLAADEEHLAVRVRSDGGRVSATLQQSVLRGLTPGGVELLSPGAAPGTTQVLPGVVIQDARTARGLREQEGYGSASPVLQVLVPGQGDAVLDVRVLGPEGPVDLPGGAGVQAAAGTVTSIPLEALPEGTYTVAVSSDVSVVAAARVVRGTRAGQPMDLASAPSIARLGGETAVVLGESGIGSLVFGAPDGDAEVRLTPVGEDGSLGEAITLELAGGTSITVAPDVLGDSTAGVLVSTTGDAVHGAQLLTLPGARSGVSVLGIPAASTVPQPVPVQLGY